MNRGDYDFTAERFAMAEEPTNKTTRRTERIGKYEILGHIATGGMGVIYKARDVDLDRLVALKLLPAEMAAQPTTLIRFQREAKAAARLRHDNIVAVFDVGEFDSSHFIALEYIDGTDLQEYINRKGRLDPEEARQIMIQAARALNHAHEQGIVHRDIKPSNFLLTQTNNRLVVKLTDFGLAIRQEYDAEFRITRDKSTVGTVDYMSPEQARDSRSADIRSDIYSLGCTFYHMLAGQAPFARGTLPERIVKHMQAAPPDVRLLNAGVPESLAAIIDRMLAKKPADRYQTPAELLHDLEHLDAVVVPIKRAPVVGKLERVAERGQKSGSIAVVPPKAKPTPRPEPREEPAPTSKGVTVAVADHGEPEGFAEPVEDEPRPEPQQSKQKAGQGSAGWILAIAGTVGVLGVVLYIALAVGNQLPDPEPGPVKPPPPIEKVPIKDPEKQAATDAKPRIDAAKDGLYHGETLDLDKVDLGAYLASKKSLAPRVVMHLTGKGVCETSPLAINGVQHLVLNFEESLVLEARPPSHLESPALFTMTGGHLELIGLHARLSPLTVVPSIVELHGASLTMSRCWLQGPLTKSAAGFKNLIAADNASDVATTLRLRDNNLIAGNTLLRLQDHVQLKASNNVFLSLGDGVHFDANRPSIALQHSFDHNTLAIRQAFFTLNAGPKFQAVGSASLQANSNAFLHPFKADEDKPIFLRGSEVRTRWTWQGRNNVYDSRIHWGKEGEVEPMEYSASSSSKLITTDTALQLDRLTLPPELRGDPNQTPPGASPEILKRKG
jgi:serine/threonine protein kinase